MNPKTKQKTYILTFQLEKHKSEKPFEYRMTCRDSDEITGEIERIRMEKEAEYDTPLKCIKVTEVKADG